MLESKNVKFNHELMLTRDENLKKWNDEDFLFYEDFFEDLQMGRENFESQENLSTPSETFSESAWLNFKTILNDIYEQKRH